MIITCEECQSSFNLDESRLRPSGSKVRCSECRAVFLAYPAAVPAAVRHDTAPIDSPEIASAFAGQQLDAMIDSFFVGEGGAVQVGPHSSNSSEAALLEDFDLDLETVADEVVESPPDQVPTGNAADRGGIAAGEADLDLDLNLDFGRDGQEKTVSGDIARFETLDLTRESSTPSDFDLGEIEKLLDFDTSADPHPKSKGAAAPSGAAALSPGGEASDDFDFNVLFAEGGKLSPSAADELDLKGLEQELDLQLDEISPAPSPGSAQSAPAEDFDLLEIDKLLEADAAKLDVEFDLLGEVSGEIVAPPTPVSNLATAIPGAVDDDAASDLDLELDFDFEEDGEVAAALSPPSSADDGSAVDFEEIDQLSGLDGPVSAVPAPREPSAADEIELDLDALLGDFDAPLATAVSPSMAEEEDLASGIESLMDEKAETLERQPDTEVDEVLSFDFGDEVPTSVSAEPSDSALDMTPEPSVIADEITDMDVPEGTYRGEEPDDDLPELPLNLAEDGVPVKSEATIKDFVESDSATRPAVEPAAGGAGDIELEFQIEEESPEAGEKATTARLVESQVPDYTATYTASSFATEGEAPVAAAAATIAVQSLGHPRPRRPSAKFPWKGLFLTLLLLLAAFAAVIALEWYGIRIPTVSQALRENPYARHLLPPEMPDLGNLQIRTTGVTSRFVENKSVGRLFVITGMARNDYPTVRSFVQLTAKLYLKGKVLSKTESAFAGNMISDAELQAADLNALKRSMKNRNGVKDANVYIPPGKELPFMVVFNEIPDNLEEYTLEVASSSPAK